MANGSAPQGTTSHGNHGLWLEVEDVQFEDISGAMTLKVKLTGDCSSPKQWLKVVTSDVDKTYDRLTDALQNRLILALIAFSTGSRALECRSIRIQRRH